MILSAFLSAVLVIACMLCTVDITSLSSAVVIVCRIRRKI